MGDREVLQQMAALDARLQRLEARTPLRPALTTSVIPVLFDTLGSDTLTTIGSTNYLGIKNPSSVPTFVAQADPTALTTFTEGLGKARLDSTSGSYVWVAIRVNPGTGVESDLVTALPNAQIWMSRKIVFMPIGSAAGTEFAPVYIPYRI